MIRIGNSTTARKSKVHGESCSVQRSQEAMCVRNQSSKAVHSPILFREICVYKTYPFIFIDSNTGRCSTEIETRVTTLMCSFNETSHTHVTGSYSKNITSCLECQVVTLKLNALVLQVTGQWQCNSWTLGYKRFSKVRHIYFWYAVRKFAVYWCQKCDTSSRRKSPYVMPKAPIRQYN